MFRTLQYINEVYTTKSFSKAAQNLLIAQPSLSLTVKKFETDRGITIFDRSVNPIQLTEEGKVYMDGITKILEIQNDLNNFVDDYNDLKTGKLTIGAPHFFSGSLLPQLITEFYKKYPYIEIKLVEKDFLILQEMVISGEIDFMIESDEFEGGVYCTHPLFIEHVLLAIPQSFQINEELKDYQLTKEDVIHNRHLNNDIAVVPMESLQDNYFILLEKGHDMYQRSSKIFNKWGFEPKVFMMLSQLMTSYNMTDNQLGISFITDTMVKLTNYGNNILYYKIDNELSERYISLAYKRNRYVSKPMKEFINMVLNNNYELLNKAT